MSRLTTDLSPELQPLCQQFLTSCKAVGINAFITETYRSPAEQDLDYAQGRTTPGNIITNARRGESPHNTTLVDGTPASKAFDFAIQTDSGELDWNASDSAWQIAIKIGEALGLISGSTFHSIKDAPHMELPNWERSLISAPIDVIIPNNTIYNQGVSMPAAGWKTFLLSFSVMALGVLQSTDVTNFVSLHPGGVTTAVGVLIGLFRLITTTAPGILVSFNAKPPAPPTTGA